MEFKILALTAHFPNQYITNALGDQQAFLYPQTFIQNV
jgi:hypothetical protein